VRTDKNGPVTGLGVTMYPLKRDNRIKQSDRRQGVKTVEEQTIDILPLSIEDSPAMKRSEINSCKPTTSDVAVSRVVTQTLADIDSKKG
jgi:hypothetical protein